MLAHLKNPRFSCISANLEPYKCNKCANFNSNFLSVLKHHIKNKHTRPFKSKKSLRNWLECDKCFFKTKVESVLLGHYVLKHNVDGKWFQCGQCSYKSTTEKSMWVHEDAKHGTGSQYHVVKKQNKKLWYRCGQCNFETLSKGVFKRHNWGIHGIVNTGELFECSKNNLETYRCEKCPDFRTHLLVDLRHHKSGHVPQHLRPMGYKCGCLETYSKFLWVVHKSLGGCTPQTPLKVVQKPPFAPTEFHQCPRCPFKSEFRGNLLKHFQKHTEFLKCDSCFFRSKYIFNMHLHKQVVHGSAKWYHCDFCLFKSKRKYNLKLHKENKHSQRSESKPDEKFYECQFCQHKSKRRYNLKTHILQKHTQLEKIQWLHCDHCEFKAKTKSILKRHNQEKHSEPRFECAHCLYKAKSKRLLILHLKSQH